ncbi:MAG: hypothetical protein IJB47_05865 [Oscillospiraceae bacterium]|nr:hypothetical protein [Oscillospiraceae bacterium]
MFGYVMANLQELNRPQKDRYHQVYCGICRQIRLQCSSAARLGLSYDMAFLSLLLMSLYEPEEQTGKPACGLHPLRPRTWTDNEYICYGACMNVALGYYNALDDYRDEGGLRAKVMTGIFGQDLEQIQVRYPRQCSAIASCLARLNQLEQEGCQNPDEPAGCFGELLGELFVYREDLWADTLRQMGQALGRFIYLADAAVDYRRDQRKKQYNPFLAMGTGEDRARWEQYLVLAMGRCTDRYERLPLVQDKKILDNILYSGVWIEYRKRQRGNPSAQEEQDD